jgi:DNA-binding helix-hairpin-helix protein with protein kinase domain
MGDASQFIGASYSLDQFNRLKVERDRALEDVAKWRRRYDVEAQQRRAEAEVADKTIRELRAEISQLCQLGPAIRSATSIKDDKDDSIAGRLKIALAELQQEHNQLADALAQEQQQHTKTRESLITALGEVLHRSK